MAEQFDVVIVGGGMGGLLAAAELAKAGKRVVLLERSSQLGGRAMSRRFASGHVFNLGPHARYELMESVSFAFLLALEALTPQQRAVLLLRDVFDYSVEETADALTLSVSNVKTTHFRARKRLEAYERSRAPEVADASRNREALENFMRAIGSQDVSAVEKLLSQQVVLLVDGGEEFHAARGPVIGAERVLTYMFRVLKCRGLPESAEPRWLNGMPAYFSSWAHSAKGEAPEVVSRLELDVDGCIREIHLVMATRKLSGLRRS